MSKTVCPECHEIRIKTPTGACCPNGHGRIQPGVTEKELATARRNRWLKSIPRAKCIPGKSMIYTIKGLEGEYKAKYFGSTISGCRIYRVPTFAEPREGMVLARRPDGQVRCMLRTK